MTVLEGGRRRELRRIGKVVLVFAAVGLLTVAGVVVWLLRELAEAIA